MRVRAASIACACILVVVPAASGRALRFGPRHVVAEMAPGGSALDLESGDLTGDGRADVLVARGRWASSGEYPISILVNDGHGGFRDQAARLFGGTVPTAQWPRQTVLADLNSDRRRDIFIGDSGLDVPPFGGHLDFLALSRPSGLFADMRANLPQVTPYFHSVAVADVDRDGDRDLALPDLGSPPRLLLNDGHGVFTEAPGRLPDLGRGFTTSVFTDANGDGWPDLVLGSLAGNGPSAVLINDHRGFFNELPGAVPPKPWGDNDIAITVRALLLNGDRYPDLLMGHTKDSPYYKGRWIQALVNRGDGTYRDETAQRLPPQRDNDAQWPYKIVTGDLNRDGATDFAIDLGNQFCCPDRRLVPPFFINRGDGTFHRLSARAFAQQPFAQLRLMDVNGDGRLDVLSLWQSRMDAPERYVVSLQRRVTASCRPGSGVCP